MGQWTQPLTGPGRHDLNNDLDTAPEQSHHPDFICTVRGFLVVGVKIMLISLFNTDLL